MAVDKDYNNGGLITPDVLHRHIGVTKKDKIILKPNFQLLLILLCNTRDLKYCYVIQTKKFCAGQVVV